MQEQFVAKIGTTTSTINRWKNSRGVPSPLALKQIDAHERKRRFPDKPHNPRGDSEHSETEHPVQTVRTARPDVAGRHEHRRRGQVTAHRAYSGRCQHAGRQHPHRPGGQPHGATLSGLHDATHIVRLGVDTMQHNGELTDGLYGADGPQKNYYGLPPQQADGTSVPLDQVVITRTADGTSPFSIFVDWDQEEGEAANQVEWYSDCALTHQVATPPSVKANTKSRVSPPGSNTGFASAPFAVANSARGATPQPASLTSDAAMAVAPMPKTRAQMWTARVLSAPERVLHTTARAHLPATRTLFAPAFVELRPARVHRTTANVLSRPARVLLQSAMVVLRSNEVLVNSAMVALFGPEGAFWHNRELRTQQHRHGGAVEKKISWRMHDEI